MKLKWLNLLLILTSLIAYLEWGGANHMFLFQAEATIITKLFSDPESVIHPFILLPLLGQVLLLISLLQKKPAKALTFTGLACIGILLLFMFFIGFISRNYKIALSVLPFILTVAAVIIHYRRRNKMVNENQNRRGAI